jgi:hypothetical protein
VLQLGLGFFAGALRKGFTGATKNTLNIARRERRNAAKTVVFIRIR